MARELMVGTLDDKPLLSITVNGTKYFVDQDTEEVFLDAKGLPKVEDEDTIAAVLEAAS